MMTIVPTDQQFALPAADRLLARMPIDGEQTLLSAERIFDVGQDTCELAQPAIYTYLGTLARRSHGLPNLLNCVAFCL